MPILDGFSAARTIRKDKQFKNLPIIAMTANVMASDLLKAKKAGMNAHISKPIDVVDMFKTFGRWIIPSNPLKEFPAAKEKPKTFTIPKIKGVDTAFGLKTCSYNTKLYVKLLRNFCTSYMNFADQFLKSFSDMDTTAPARIAHTLKGVSANLGAKGVQKSAANLEHACFLGKPENDIRELLDSVLVKLNPVIEAIKAFTSTYLEESTTSEHTPFKISDHISNLKNTVILCESYNTQALKNLTKIEAHSKGHSANPLLNKALDHMAEYEYEEAAKVIQSVLDNNPL